MRHRFTITITEPTGSRHYELPKIAKRIFHGTLLGTVGSIASAIYIILVLYNNITDLEASKKHLSMNLASLNADYDDLAGQLDTQVKEFQAIDQKVENLEELIGLDPPDDSSLQQRVELANLDAMQKRAMLNSIPNGYPIQYQQITSGFGKRKHPTLKKKEFHRGVDLKADMNTPVKATADGVVEYAGFHKKSGFGNLLILHHSFGFKTSYGHLNKILVKPGDFVAKDTVIARTGNSGISSGPHLHYEIRFVHRALDPRPFMQWRLDNYEEIFKEKSVQWPSLVNLLSQRLIDPTRPSLQLVHK
jgi:murein DD-endopeptidase MepM/ murein hydrolase activator NlpD